MTNFALRDARAGDEPAIRQVVYRVLEEFELATDPSGLDSDLADVTASYLGRGGSFRVLTTRVGQIVGCGGLYPMDAGVAELRKIFFLPIARGHGFGRRLIGGSFGIIAPASGHTTMIRAPIKR